MTAIGSRIIKQINSLQNDVDDLKLSTLETLLEVYFRNIIPEDNYELEESEQYRNLSSLFSNMSKVERIYDEEGVEVIPDEEEAYSRKGITFNDNNEMTGLVYDDNEVGFKIKLSMTSLYKESLSNIKAQLAQDLSAAQENFKNFISRCLLPENYNELLKIIETIESIADINLHKNLSKESLVSINELLKTYLYSKQIYESIKVYTKNPHEDKRNLTAILMMLLSGGDKKNVYYIKDIELNEEPESISDTIITTPFDLDVETISMEELIPKMTNTPTLSEAKSKTPSPQPELGSRKMTITPVVFLFANRKASVTPLVSSEQVTQTFPPKMSPILSPRKDSKNEPIKTHVIKNSFNF